MVLLWATLSIVGGFASGLFGLLLGATFTRLQRAKYPLLRLLDGRQLALFGLCVISLFVGFVADLAKEWAQVAPIIQEARQFVGPSFTAEASFIEPHRARLNAAVSTALSAEELYTRQDYSGSLERFQLADDLADVAAIKARIADSNFYLGDYVQAIEYPRAAIALAPNWSGPPYMLAHSLLRVDRVDEARRAATRSCDLGFQGGCELAASISAR